MHKCTACGFVGEFPEVEPAPLAAFPDVAAHFEMLERQIAGLGDTVLRLSQFLGDDGSRLVALADIDARLQVAESHIVGHEQRIASLEPPPASEPVVAEPQP